MHSLQRARVVTIEATTGGLVLVDGDDRLPVGEIGAWEGAAELDEGASLEGVAIGMRHEHPREHAYREPSPPVRVHVRHLIAGSLDALTRDAREQLIERAARVGVALLLGAIPILAAVMLLD